MLTAAATLRADLRRRPRHQHRRRRSPCPTGRPRSATTCSSSRGRRWSAACSTSTATGCSAPSSGCLTLALAGALWRRGRAPARARRRGGRGRRSPRASRRAARRPPAPTRWRWCTAAGPGVLRPVVALAVLTSAWMARRRRRRSTAPPARSRWRAVAARLRADRLRRAARRTPVASTCTWPAPWPCSCWCRCVTARLRGTGDAVAAPAARALLVLLGVQLAPRRRRASWPASRRCGSPAGSSRCWRCRSRTASSGSLILAAAVVLAVRVGSGAARRVPGAVPRSRRPAAPAESRDDAARPRSSSPRVARERAPRGRRPTSRSPSRAWSLMVLVTTVVGYYVGARRARPTTRRLVAPASSARCWRRAARWRSTSTGSATSTRCMERTRTRPLPDGRLAPLEALLFGAGLTAAGLAVPRRSAVGWLATLVTAATFALYLFAYTPLKLRTSLCTLVGAVPGRAAARHRLGGRARRPRPRRLGALRDPVPLAAAAHARHRAVSTATTTRAPASGSCRSSTREGRAPSGRSSPAAWPCWR